MDVSPTLRLDEHFKPDLFDLDYDIGSDFGSFEDLVVGGRHIGINNNNIGDVVLGHAWGDYNPYPDTTIPNNHNIMNHDKSKPESSDKMWGGGGTTEKIVNATSGNTILITFPNTDPVSTDTPDNSHIPSPQSCDLFPTILTDKPFDVLVSHSHRSPASDCVSFVSAGSGYSDSGISTSLDETASPVTQTSEPVDFDHLVSSAMDQMHYSPGDGGGLPSVEESTVLDAGGGYGGNYTYITSTLNQNQNSPILEEALRGGRRMNHHSSHVQTSNSLKSEAKTLTVMNNMTPLPSLSQAFKPETLGLPPSQPQISSSNGIGVYAPTYEYTTQGPEEFTNLDSSFTKLSTTASSSTKMDGESKGKKRKYTKRGSIEEPSSKGRLLHFCNVCNKGFKDKYSVNVHLRTHTGEKPFNCELCGKCFRQKAHLAKHVQIHSAPKPPGKR